MMQPVDIPAYLDNPPQILFLESDDIVPAFVPVFFGIILRYTTHDMYWIPLSALVGVGFSYYYIKIKRDALTGVLLHLMYSRGLGPINKRYNNGFVKRLDN